MSLTISIVKKMIELPLQSICSEFKYQFLSSQKEGLSLQYANEVIIFDTQIDLHNAVN